MPLILEYVLSHVLVMACPYNVFAARNPVGLGHTQQHARFSSSQSGRRRLYPATRLRSLFMVYKSALIILRADMGKYR